MTEDEKLPCKGKFCRRPGLPILPLRVAYVPNGAGELPGGVAASAFANSVYHQLIGHGKSPGKLMLRVISEGYVYVYDPNQYDSPWRCYAATSDGRFKETIVADQERPEKQPTFGCSRVGDNLEASLISIENAKNADKVLWVGYSRIWWTKSIRRRIRSDPQLRKAYMVTIDARALYLGTEKGRTATLMDHAAFRLEATGKALKEHVLEYLPDRGRVEKLCSDTSTRQVRIRLEEAGPLAARMHERSNGQGGVVLALPDIVGLARDTACWRNISAGRLAHYKAAEATLRPKIVRDVILGLKHSMVDNDQGDQWTKRYAPKLDMARLMADKEAEEKAIEQYTGVIERASRDWRAVVSQTAFKIAWNAYDGKLRDSGMALERDFASCVQGSGALKEEKRWWLDGWLSDKYEEDNPLWKALAAGDDDVVTQMLSIGGTGLSIYHSARKGFEAFNNWLKERREHNRTRPATQDSGAIAGTVASLLPLLLQKQAERAEVIGARLRIILAARADTVLEPARIYLSVKTVVSMLYETSWGPPTTTMSRRVMHARSALLTQSVGGGFVGGRFSDATLIELNLWLPQGQAELLEQAAVKALRAPTGSTEVTIRNPFTATREFVKTADARWVGLFGALALWNLTAALHGVQKTWGEGDERGAQDFRESVFGVVTGVLAVGASVTETIGKVQGKQVSSAARNQIVEHVAKDIAKTASEKAATGMIVSGVLFEVGGSMFAMGVAWAEGLQDFAKANRLLRDGDRDAAYLYKGAGFMMFVSGLAGAAAAMVQGAEILAGVGATGTLTSIVISFGSVLACIPVGGWIAIGLVTFVAGIYLAYQALTREDTPLEVWLSRCWYRNAEKYDGTERTLYADSRGNRIELEAFQNALYGLQITFEWDDSWFGKDDLTVRVIMPGYSDYSDFAYALQTRGVPSEHWMTLNHRTSDFSYDPDLRSHPPEAVMSAIRPDQELIPMEEVIEIVEPLTVTFRKGMAVLTARFKINPDYEDHARLKFHYWPDAAQHPELVMTAGPNGMDFREARR